MILVDSCCDLPKSIILENKDYMDVIGIPVDIGNFSYFDDLGQTFHHESLYDDLREGIKPSTSQINSFRFLEKYKKHVKKGYDIIYIGLSSQLSGSNRNAVKAIGLLEKDYPEGCVKVLESTCVSLGQGLLALKAIEMVKAHETTETIFDWLINHQDFVQHWFAVDDLHHLKNGGRISKTKAVAGTFLNIKPILRVDAKGEIKSYAKVKGRKKSIEYLCNQVKALYNPEFFDQILIGHGDALEEAVALKERLKIFVPEGKIIVTKLSATIASHVGPGMLAIGFMGQDRNKEVMND